MDTAIRAEWYDLEDADRDGFLDWFHGDYLPALQAKPGVIWVGHYDRATIKGKDTAAGSPPRVVTDDPSVAKGSQYLLVTAAPSVDVFFDPHVAEETDPEIKAHLAKRREHRLAIFVEETRVSGPEWYRQLPGTSAPPAIQFGNYATRSQADDLDLEYWYRRMRLPQVTRTRGCMGARKLVCVIGWAKHGILYEFLPLDPDESNFEQRFYDAGLTERWTGRHVLEIVIHQPRGPHAGTRLWPPVTS